MGQINRNLKIFETFCKKVQNYGTEPNMKRMISCVTGTPPNQNPNLGEDERYTSSRQFFCIIFCTQFLQPILTLVSTSEKIDTIILTCCVTQISCIYYMQYKGRKMIGQNKKIINNNYNNCQDEGHVTFACLSCKDNKEMYELCQPTLMLAFLHRRIFPNSTTYPKVLMQMVFLFHL